MMVFARLSPSTVCAKPDGVCGGGRYTPTLRSRALASPQFKCSMHQGRVKSATVSRSSCAGVRVAAAAGNACDSPLQLHKDFVEVWRLGARSCSTGCFWTVYLVNGDGQRAWRVESGF